MPNITAMVIIGNLIAADVKKFVNNFKYYPYFSSLNTKHCKDLLVFLKVKCLLNIDYLFTYN